MTAHRRGVCTSVILFGCVACHSIQPVTMAGPLDDRNSGRTLEVTNSNHVRYSLTDAYVQSDSVIGMDRRAGNARTAIPMKEISALGYENLDVGRTALLSFGTALAVLTVYYAVILYLIRNDKHS